MNGDGKKEHGPSSRGLEESEGMARRGRRWMGGKCKSPTNPEKITVAVPAHAAPAAGRLSHSLFNQQHIIFLVHSSTVT